jgi:hypothetical protein
VGLKEAQERKRDKVRDIREFFKPIMYDHMSGVVVWIFLYPHRCAAILVTIVVSFTTERMVHFFVQSFDVGLLQMILGEREESQW